MMRTLPLLAALMGLTLPAAANDPPARLARSVDLTDRARIALPHDASADAGLLPANEARPATLTGGSWTVTALAGGSPAGRHPVTLRFDQGGRLGGQGPCNTYGGQWGLEGGRLSVRGVFATRMACPEPAMTQERALFRILESARAWRIGAQGELVIEGEGGALTARR